MQLPMRWMAMVAVLVMQGAVLDTVPAQGPETKAATSPSSPSVPLARRPPWTGSRIVGAPEPPHPYTTEVAYPALKFNQPVDLTLAPGTNRLFVAEQSGKIYSFTGDPGVAQADLAVDLAREIPGVRDVYAIAFHPQFERNRYVYICCIRAPELEDGTRVSRFRVSETDPPTIDAQSEQVLITWLSGGHNGCCLKFGPDGYLYISTGDGVGPNPPDTRKTGQDISDLLSSILRIDVDHAEPGRNYRVPADNPFITLSNARPEVWAYGFRNPWRMGFDRKTGDLWVGDVGWELWELLYRVERGGNYGWGVMEGRQPTNPEWPRGPTPILSPTVDHPHSESSSITGGVTYYGAALPELQGAHIYGDYDTGKIWGLRWEQGKVVWHRELADTTLRIVGFGEDAASELYLLDHIGGTLHRLIPNPYRDQPSRFPRKLSETGLFTSVTDQVPAPGVVPFSIQSTQWQDGASAERFIGLPGESQIKTGSGAWQFPAGTVLAKTVFAPAPGAPGKQGTEAARDARQAAGPQPSDTPDRPEQPKRSDPLETQILHYTGQDWRAYTYAWNADRTDAELVDALGEDRSWLASANRSNTAGQNVASSVHSWHFAGRAECLRCHNPWSGSTLGFQAPQLNQTRRYGTQELPQLEALYQLGLFDQPVQLKPEPQRLVDPHDTTASLNDRARSYLHANCAHCHRLHAGSSVLSKLQYDLPLEKASLLGERPTQGTFGIPAAEVVAPGDPYRSILLYRMSKIGSGRMPHLGSQLVDPSGVDLVHRWIDSLPADSTPDEAVRLARARRETQRQLLGELQQHSGDKERVERAAGQLLTTTTGALMLVRAIDRQLVADAAVPAILAQATAQSAVEIRDLFERFLPEEQRVRRLGSVIRPEEILRLAGDAQRGRSVFFEAAGVQCKNCHRIDGVGKDLGPDLSQIGKKYDRGQLLESILDPSKFIDPKYVAYLIETRDGRLMTGLLVQRDEREAVLRDAQDQRIVVPTSQIERLVAQSASLMPELLLRDLTAEQVADLLAFLNSRR
ncbi:MAG: PQQ-dependent sugar dehydrogenase [Pirellulaceae bacterium]